MTQPLFDQALGALRRQRARRKGPTLFLAERACDDILERLALVRRHFRRALVIGLPDPAWIDRFSPIADEIVSLPTLDDLVSVEPGSHDLCIVVSLLDTADDLPLWLRVIRAALSHDALFVGAFAGNNSLPALRTTMLAADRAAGGASPRVHPRIEASALASLLQDAGFTMPVVDIDRVRLRYRRLEDLVADLRGMGATNILLNRSRKPLGRAALAAARQAFADAGDDNGTLETLEIIHFASWSEHAAVHGE